MKLKARILIFLFLLITTLLYFINQSIQLFIYSTIDPLPSYEYHEDIQTNTTFTQITEGVLLQFSFDDKRVGNMGPRSIRMIIISKSKPKLSCIFDNGDIELGSWYDMAENHNKIYGVYILSCTVPPSIRNVHKFSLTNDKKEWTVSDIIVNYVIPPIEPTQFKWEYSICSPLVFGKKYTKENLVEFIEMNKLLGVQKITLYVDEETVNEGLLKAVNYYRKEGILDAIRYHPPVDAIWYYGQLGMITDCLIKHSTLSRFVSFQDLDEIIINPNGKRTIDVAKELLIDKVASRRIPTHVMSVKSHEHPLYLSNTLAVGMGDNLFTKCIIRPYFVFEQGIHHTSRTIYDDYLIERATFNELRVLHYRREGNLNGQDTSITQYYKDHLSHNYYRANDRIY